jgi:hypothetical protein
MLSFLRHPIFSFSSHPFAPDIHNEQIKLFATFPNNLATALIAVGGLAPTLAALQDEMTIFPFVAFLLWCSLGAVLGFVTERVLMTLQPLP